MMRPPPLAPLVPLGGSLALFRGTRAGGFRRAALVIPFAIAGCATTTFSVDEGDEAGASLDAATPDVEREEPPADPDAGEDPPPDATGDVRDPPTDARFDTRRDARRPDSSRDALGLDAWARDASVDVSSPWDAGIDVSYDATVDAVPAPPDAAGEAVGCVADGDCRTFSSYCDGTTLRPCRCLALPATAPAPTCDGRPVRCVVDPCILRRAVCRRGRCRTVH